MAEQRYLVTARKYRPQLFRDVVAQQHVTDTLKNALRLDRLAHAYLFSGPRGVGKTTTARILAKAINCETPREEREDEAEPCCACESCESFEAGRSMNVFEMDAASNNKVDDIRELRETVRIPPQGNQKKVYILDEVHMLSTQAFNALLKTLEEPPSHALFIFATTEPHKVLPTILSRCQRFDFRRIPVPEMVDHLRSICDREGIEADEESLMLLARKGEGALRDALSAFDQAISLCGMSLEYGDLTQALGVVDQDLFFELTGSVAAQDTAGVLRLVDGVVRNGYDLQEFLVGLAEHLRHLLVARSLGGESLEEVAEATQARYVEEASRFGEADLLRLLTIAGDAEDDVKSSTQPRLKLELALLKMAQLRRVADLRRVLEKIDRLEQMVDDGTLPDRLPSDGTAPSDSASSDEPPPPDSSPSDSAPPDSPSSGPTSPESAASSDAGTVSDPQVAYDAASSDAAPSDAAPSDAAPSDRSLSDDAPSPASPKSEPSDASPSGSAGPDGSGAKASGSDASGAPSTEPAALAAPPEPSASAAEPDAAPSDDTTDDATDDTTASATHGTTQATFPPEDETSADETSADAPPPDATPRGEDAAADDEADAPAVEDAGDSGSSESGSGVGYGDLFGTPALKKKKTSSDGSAGGSAGGSAHGGSTDADGASRAADDDAPASGTQGDGQAAGGPASQAALVAEPSESGGVATASRVDVLETVWDDFVGNVIADRIGVGVLLKETHPVDYQQGTVTIGVPKALHRDQLRDATSTLRTHLAPLVDTVDTIQFVVEASEPEPDAEPDTSMLSPTEKLERLRPDYPALDALFTQFGAEPVFS